MFLSIAWGPLMGTSQDLAQLADTLGGGGSTQLCSCTSSWRQQTISRVSSDLVSLTHLIHITVLVMTQEEETVISCSFRLAAMT